MLALFYLPVRLLKTMFKLLNDAYNEYIENDESDPPDEMKTDGGGSRIKHSKTRKSINKRKAGVPWLFFPCRAFCPTPFPRL